MAGGWRMVLRLRLSGLVDDFKVLSIQHQTVLYIPRHCEEHSDVAIHAESVKAVKEGSPRRDRSGLAMTNRRHFSFDTLLSC